MKKKEPTIKQLASSASHAASLPGSISFATIRQSAARFTGGTEGRRVEMQAIVRRTRIDIEGASDVPEGTWIRLLDELKAVRMPGLTPPGKRMMLAINQSGRMDAFIYRTGLTDEEVICILAKYGIEAHTWVI